MITGGSDISPPSSLEGGSSQASRLPSRALPTLAPMIPRTVSAVFPSKDPVALFLTSICIASNDVEDTYAGATAANPPNSDDPDIGHRRRFSYRVRMMNGHLYEGIVALKAWRQSEAGVRKLLDDLSAEAKEALKLVCGLEQRIGAEALGAIRQNSFHYPHPDSKRSPDSTVELAEAIRVNPDLEAGIDIGDDARGTFRFADQLALSVAFGGHDQDEDRATEQMAKCREAARAFVFLTKEIYLLYCRQRGIGFKVVD